MGIGKIFSDVSTVWKNYKFIYLYLGFPDELMIWFGAFPGSKIHQYLQIMEYLSVLKRDELSSHKKIQRKLKYLLVKEAALKRLHTV